MTMVRKIAKAICKSRTCQGHDCCEWPANMGKRHECKAKDGAYDDAAVAALEALKQPSEEMLRQFQLWGVCAGYVDKAWEAALEIAINSY